MIDDLVSMFQSFKTILCVCPHCGDLVRISDLHLSYKGAAPRTWLDTYQNDEKKLEKLESEFDEKVKAIHAAALKRAHLRVPQMVNKCIHDSIARLKFNPYYIKALYHPVDLVVFNGLKAGGKVEDITFLSRRTQNTALNKIRSSLESTIDKGSYDWRLARVSLKGELDFE